MLPPSVRIFVAVCAVDLRRSFDGLSALVRDVVKEEPLSGHLFVFFGRRGDLVKILWWVSAARPPSSRRTCADAPWRA